MKLPLPLLKPLLLLELFFKKNSYFKILINVLKININNIINLKLSFEVSIFGYIAIGELITEMVLNLITKVVDFCSVVEII